MRSSVSAMSSSPKVLVVARVLLGIVFLWASLPKIVDPRSFAEIVGNYRMLPPVLVNPVAVVLPWIEAVCGAALICGRLIRGSAFVSVVLILIFSAASAFNLYRGLDVDCGCFSVAGDNSPGATWYHLLRNALILALAAFVLRRTAAAGKG